MIQGNDIICFSNDWDGDPLSKKHIALRLARKNRVLWVNSTGNRNPTASVRDLRRIWKKLWQYCRGCRPVEENIHVFSPLVIPFHGSRAARWINRRLLAWDLRRACRNLGFQKPITWSFVPSSADVAGSLGERLVVYHCVDEYSEFTGTNKTAILDMERRLMERADLVVVSSSRLYETKLRHNRNTFLVTHGVDVAHFRKACLEETATPQDCAALRGPVIGFFGLIGDWVDLEIVRHLAVSRPEWSLLLIGKVEAGVDTSALRKLTNVHILGRRPYQSLPAYCKAFDIAILPFVVNELTLAANPLKLREYLAAGLPVVATPLPEACKLDRLQGKRGPSLATSLLMEPESWDEKVEVLSGFVTDLDGSGRRHEQALTA
jgi:glycosyltransferase involved in cell wall biosynthesis